MKTIIITGASSGIGKSAAMRLASGSARLLLLGRDSEKSRRAAAEIIATSGNSEVFLYPVDLAQKDAVTECAAELAQRYPSIDALVNNAGVYKVKRRETTDGIEETFAVNFIAPYILTQILLPNLIQSGSGRIINVISELYRSASIPLDDIMMNTKYSAGAAYGRSKLALGLYTIELSRLIAPMPLKVMALHPGVLATSAFREYPNLLIKILNLFLEKPAAGGERIARLAASENLSFSSGSYIYKDEPKPWEIPVAEREKAGQLMKIAEGLTGLACTAPG
jgi:retinol dehydrogenase-14